MTEIILILGTFCAGVLKVGFGQGAGILAVPLYTLVVSPRAANAILAPLLALSDLFSIRAYWRQWDTRLLKIFLPGVLLGVVLGAYALAHLSDPALRRMIGGALMAVVAVQFWARRYSGNGTGKVNLWVAVLIALISGAISTIAQVGAAFLTVYLMRLRTAKKTTVPTLNITFFFGNVAKTISLWRYGLITKATWSTDLWLVPALLAGCIGGLLANRLISERAFENIVLSCALVAGGALIVHP